MGRQIAYGCVVSGIHSTKAGDKISEADAAWRLNTKVADEIKKLKNLFIPEEIVKIDVIDSTRRHRKHLETALQTMSYGDTIIISSLGSLGLNNDEVVKNYKRIYDKKIGLLLPNYQNKNGLSIFATTNFSFSSVSIDEDEISILCKKIAFEEIKTHRGRKMIGITDEFKAIYWYYERYLIDPITACRNKFFCVSKNTFRRLCEEYEKSSEYISDLEQQEILYKLSGLPKRYGVISESMRNLIVDVAEVGMPFSDACFIHDIQMSKIQFDRYLLKYYISKGKLMHATFQLRDYELMEELQPDYDFTEKM